MDLIDQLRALGERIEKQIPQVATEEAAKTAFIMPFIQALGYNVFDPTEVVPEFTADVGTKKGEKVDYAILVDGEPAILFECKWNGPELDEKHASQLFRYFSVTKARIAVLTNGVVYRFYSDIEDKNKMDARPFLVLDMRALGEPAVAELKGMTRDHFDLDAMLSAAGELKYLREIKAQLRSEMEAPSEEFMRLFFARVAPGRRLTGGVKDQFSGLIRRALSEFLRDNVNRRLETALSANTDADEPPTRARASEVEQASVPADSIETTQEELEGFYLVKSLLRDVVDLERIVHRDSKTYFAILLDDNNRRPICRLWLNGVRKKHLSLFDAAKNETKVEIGSLDDIYSHADQIRSVVQHYLAQQASGEASGARLVEQP